jgi:hypothetical protein
MSARQLLGIAIILLCAPAAPAKERTAGCPGFPRASLRVEGTIRLGAPVWNAGNQLATYALYRDLATALLARPISGECGALRAPLSDALARAHEALTPGTAGWDLRHGLDAFLEYAMRGESPKIAQPVTISGVVAPYYGDSCEGLFPLVLRAERALAEGHAAAEARAMAAELARSGMCPHVRAALQAGLDGRAPEAALDRLTMGQPPPGQPGAPAPLLDRCTLLPSLAEELAFAVLRGAPRFDDGHPERCVAVYRQAAEAAIAEYGRAGHCQAALAHVRAGMAEAKREHNPAKAAWALRHAFDAVLEGFARVVPQ